MNYKQRISILVTIDSIIVLFSSFIGFDSVYSSHLNKSSSILLISSLSLYCFHHIFGYQFGLYTKVWGYAGIKEVMTIFNTVTSSIISTAIIQFLISGIVYGHILFITWMTYLILVGGSRYLLRLRREVVFKNGYSKKNTIIIGGGSGGLIIARLLLQDEKSTLKPVAFLDDNKSKHKLEILGIPVVGKIDLLEKVVVEKDIEHIIIAIPSLSRIRLNEIYNLCLKTKLRPLIIPRIEDIAEGKITVSQLRDVSVEDLLGRESVKLDDSGISEKISKNVILVTGAGGSIGSEICRQLIKYNPKKIVLLGHGENSIYTIEMELLETLKNSQVEIVSEIADIQDRQKMFNIMGKYKPNIVYHAAAHKHVPLMESNPDEAVKNNIFGTKNVAEAADCFQVGTFVMVSTDKAVNPTNVMGATKRAAEMVIQSINSISKTKFVVVRFGNVLGSRGSVIPRFKSQISNGGPVTVTHPEMTRYFMTIPEASRLVIQASTFANGGELFVLDMGDPIKIVDLAKNLISLSGYEVDEIGVEFTGLRPGEKMYEELLLDEEGLDTTSHKKIFVGKPIIQDYNVIIQKLKEMENVLEDKEKVILKLKEIVPTYCRNDIGRKANNALVV